MLPVTAPNFHNRTPYHEDNLPLRRGKVVIAN